MEICASSHDKGQIRHNYTMETIAKNKISVGKQKHVCNTTTQTHTYTERRGGGTWMLRHNNSASLFTVILE